MTADTCRRKGLTKLGIATAAMLLVWGVLLPVLAEVPVIEAHIKHLDAKHVDASALYYTDLDPRVFKPDDPDQPTR